MNGPLTYIAGPYSSDPARNTRRAIEVLHALLDDGVPSICPHLSHLADMVRSRDYEDWMALDLLLLERCDVVLRIHGPSAGADREMDHAVLCMIPTVHLPEVVDLSCLGDVVRRTAL